MVSSTSGYSLNPSWPHFLGYAVIAFSLCIGVGRYILFDQFDPLHCEALINRGSWLDFGRRAWQPDGCMLRDYTPKDSSKCLGPREVVFIGDSVTRRLFFQFAHLVDALLPTQPEDPTQKHANHTLRSKNGFTASFYWDPFLNTSHTFQSASLGTHEEESPVDFPQRPVLLVLGGGLWYLRYQDSGGLSSWEANMERLLHQVGHGPHLPADRVVFLPVEDVVSVKLSPERAKTMHSYDIDAMNSDLYHRIHSPLADTVQFLEHTAPLPISLPSVFNQLLDPSQTQDGLHFSDAVVQTQANILLNLHCNDKLSKRPPFDSTCCRSYPWPNIPQSLFIGTLVAFATYGIYVMLQNRSSIEDWLSIAETSPITTICVAGIIIFLADRTGIWLKEQKSFSPWTFAFLTLSALALGLATVKRADKDLGFLNREQTDEWKGWMQVAILIYHYLGASKISGIYNPIRVLVASYLFMTGYGHTTYYLKKADFAFLRIAQVMLRLNLFTLLLAYLMDADYLAYYFSPLVSLWFMIIYLTMLAGHQYNDRTSFLVAKFLASAGLVTLFMYDLAPLEFLFDILGDYCGIYWSAKEWSFRVKLDLWIVYVGMFTALAVVKIRERRLTELPQWPLAVNVALGASVTAFLWYFAFELYQESKFTYNLWHPYISAIPVLAFVVLRNANAILRSANSRFFAFIGRCSLETFIIQYHLWLAGDTKGVLLVLPGTSWRPLNFVVTSIMFIYVSDQVARATGHVVGMICSDNSKPKPQALPTSSTGATELSTSNVNTQRGTESGENSSGQRLRWVDRLAENPRPSRTAGSWSNVGVKMRIGLLLVLMWLLNMSWSYPLP
ncbi:Cas1p-domain-containing protein [Dendrothele bispora CBS 962.96]|uniref:Cas1p-domain-containing protein n=1 Tax=Dendrothele bispora (strain CBS 962.96) TaxID=1314807 RepID=A0A4S8MY92_DENBC|nr:Cas1p-domain-containing protein [Dendrothele bispora CBS 962.96]